MLAVWRITHLLSSEDGPWRLSARFRQVLVKDGFWADLLNCFYCLSLWISAPFAYWIGAELGERALLVAGYLGGGDTPGTSYRPSGEHSARRLF